MYKSMFLAIGLAILLLVGCAQTGIDKKEVTKSDDNYTLVINKSIKDCAEYEIFLNEKRTNHFMRRSPKKTIDKASIRSEKTPQKLCQFFAEETSLEKIEGAKKLAGRIIVSCEKVGVALPKEGIENKVRNLPFFIIKKGLSLEKDSSLEECELMKEKYQ